MRAQTIDYGINDTPLTGYAVFPEANNAPLVLVTHAWRGKDEFVHQRAHELAKLGYVGFAVDLYGQGKVCETQAECQTHMDALLNNRSLLKQTITAGLETGQSLPGVNPNKVAAIGYCFGGLAVLDLARSGADIQGVVSFHGSLIGSTIATSGIKAKVLALHGERDPMIPCEQVLAFQQEMTQANADWQLHSYGHTLHAFTHPEANDIKLGTQYNERAARRSWQSMQNFLTELFT